MPQSLFSTQEKLLWNGSSKDIYQRGKHLILEFTDFVSVFDVGRIPTPFMALGAIRTSVSATLFYVLEEARVKTHYLSWESDTRIRVTPFLIPEKPHPIVGASGRHLPLEFLFRFVITPKFLARIEKGSVSHEAVRKLLPRGTDMLVGARMFPAFVETSTKHRAADTYLTDAEAAACAEVSLAKLQSMYGVVSHAAERLKDFFHTEASLDLWDGKFEGALNHNNRFVVTDSLSPDELRLVGKDGERYDKDIVREWYKDNHGAWVAELMRAKDRFPDDATQWPPYPESPPLEVVMDVVNRYQTVADRIGARR
jgi:phosphoribosylaminoimidazole-succinocarboxamide synthase